MSPNSFITTPTKLPTPSSPLHTNRTPLTRPRMTAATAKPATHWITENYGMIEYLTLTSTTIPPPAPHEIRIRVRAAGLNFADVFACLGLYDLAGPPPLIPGFEVCGTVDAVGSSVHTYSPGDKVFGLTRFGGYTTMLNLHTAYVHRLPDGWSFEEGAAYPVQTFTAWYALCVLGGLPSDGSPPRMVTSHRKSVLVHSAAGGVGLQLVAMVQKLGGVVVCTVGSDRKVDLLVSRGVPRERIIVRGVDDKDGFETAVRDRALGGEGLDVVVDSVMGDYFTPAYNLLNRGGRHIVMGSASLMPRGPLSLLKGGIGGLLRLGWKYLNRPQLDMLKAINENKTVSAFNLAGLFEETQLMEIGFRELAEMDLPKPKVGRTFNFDDVQDALTFFQTGQSVGKLVLVVDEDQ